MLTTNKEHIANLASICAKNGIRKVVLSPGSRNAPLVIAFESNPNIETYLVHDERVAAFFAMGLAESLNQPVAICCTSGSAVLNYAPAIVEAYYRQIPLFILTADRPPELIDQGDGQTIRQKKIYANYIKSQFQLDNEPQSKEEIHRSNILVERAITDLISSPKGPVHMNIPLSEPLYNTTEIKLQERSPVVVQEIDAFKNLEKSEIIEAWKTSEKKLLIIGQNANRGLLEHLRPLLELPDLAVMVENTSNIYHFGKIIHSIDRTLAAINETELEDFAPDLLMTCGGAVISKRIKAYFRKLKPKHNWRVGNFLISEDTFQSLTLKIPVEPALFFDFLGGLQNNELSNFGNRWKQKDLLAFEQHENYLSSLSELSDLKVFDTLVQYLPDHSVLHMGNSSVIRYFQLFNPISTVTYHSNRGVSGIDGSLSTAIGIALGQPNKLHTVVLGDISFLYDSNGLWIEYLPKNLRIVVVNNGGGGIFKILPDAEKSQFNNRFFAPTQVNIQKLAEAFSIDYKFWSPSDDLNDLFQTFFQEGDSAKLLEVNTASIENHQVLNGYFAHIKTID